MLLRRETVVLEGQDAPTQASRRWMLVAGVLVAAVVGVTVLSIGNRRAKATTQEFAEPPEVDVEAAGRVVPMPRIHPSESPKSQARTDPEFAELERDLPDLGTSEGASNLYDPHSAGGVPRARSATEAVEELRQAQLLRWEETSFESLQAALIAPIRGSATDGRLQGRHEGDASGGERPAGLAMLEQSLATLAGSQGMAEGGSRGIGAGEGGPGPQERKQAFFREGGKQLETGALVARQTPGDRRYTLRQGAMFSAALETPINSELPGQIRARITQNVYDTASGANLLIPSGTTVVGTDSSDVSTGQERVQVAWTRLILPNSDPLDLGSMSGGDVGGMTGLKDRVNRHFGRVLGAALLMSAPMVTYELTAPVNQQSVEGAVHRGVGNSLLQVGSKLAERETSIAPTIEIRRGTRITIHVNKDIFFEGPYEDGHRWRRRR